MTEETCDYCHAAPATRLVGVGTTSIGGGTECPAVRLACDDCEAPDFNPSAHAAVAALLLRKKDK